MTNSIPVRRGDGLRVATERQGAKNFCAHGSSFEHDGVCVCDKH